MIYKPASRKDSSQIAHLHLNTFHGFFLSELGYVFLNIYYKCVIKSKESICICCFNDNNTLQGFIVGCKLSKGFNKRLVINSPLSFIFLGLYLLVSNPGAIVRLLKNIEKKSSKSDLGNYAEILSICVSDSCNGTGIGSSLLKEFEKEIQNSGKQKSITLTTDWENNDHVLRFYFKNGYNELDTFITYPNRKMYKLIKNL